MIENYKFGSITIDGKTYNHDVEVRWTDEVLKWWRKESHLIDAEDVKRAVEQNPDTIIIGTGESGIARVTEDTQRFITKENIKLIIDKTGEAVKTFNIIKRESEREERRQRKVIGLFHLTC
ncbi:MAG: Mth938-like domain-containing protein [Candidatus Nealsonbacteria bacterium]